MIRVFHNTDFLGTTTYGNKIEVENLHWVATIDTDDLETAFALMQDIGDWTHRPKIIRHTSLIVRSTSVGDVFVDQYGQPWRAAPIGFVPIYHLDMKEKESTA